MTIYLHGCSCGPIAAYLRKVKTYGRENDLAVDVVNTKYDKQAMKAHVNYLIENDLDMDSYPPIVVDGSNVVLLSQWKP